MRILRAILRGIDSINNRVGLWVAWLVLALVLVEVFEVISRFGFNAPTTWAYETSCMLGGIIYLIGWAYCYLHDIHVRVDIIYTHLSPRGKAIMDVVCALIFLFPLAILLLKTSIPWTVKAWEIGEVMAKSHWYPPAAPYRTVFSIGIFLLTLQCLARFIRDLHFAIRSKPLD